WHPSKYAELLAEKMRKHNARVWLVNTGWGGGGPGVGKRISLKNTRAIIDAIHDGSLAKAQTERDPVFRFEIAAECPGVPLEILVPRNAWADKAAYEATAKKLAGLFNKNFETYAAGVSAKVKASAPKALRMGWLFELHKTQPIAHAIGVLTFVCVFGMALGSLKLRGI